MSGLEEEAQEEAKEMYECSSCQMYFPDVMDHVRRYHGGQNVVLEMDEEPREVAEEALEEPEAVAEEEDQEYTIEYITDEPTEVMKVEREDEAEPRRPEKVDMPMKSRHVKVERFWEAPAPLPTEREPSPRPSRRHLPDDPDPLDVYKCGECGTVFPNNKSLRLHVKMHKPIHQRTIEEAIQSDMRGVRGRPEQKNTFHCDKCGKDYDEAFMEMHMRMHSDEPSFHCTICNKKFESEESFRMHSNVHQERATYAKESRRKDAPRPYACQYCDKAFIRPHEKVKHERIHTGEKPHACEVCGKTFRVAYCLTLHMRTHTMVRPYVCSLCGRRFKAHAVYNHHMKTHGDERNYKCPFCPKAFKTAVQLSGHKNSHTKPFSCTECNRPFASLYSVRAHMEMHRKPANGLRYKCDICGATYARNSSVKDHIKEAHGDDPLMEETELFTEIDRAAELAVETLEDAKIVATSIALGSEADDEVLVAEAEWID
ncbi:zinc finger protein 771 [Phlebotomus argentipes]|uniref:zinc finger protein 771 n=1 Tax=Phlebotomus argentipes TaxID=94469 RepID=UPI002892CC94|nr:zinc finger protein 771 [Phlebotomus argentipes]